MVAIRAGAREVQSDGRSERTYELTSSIVPHHFTARWNTASRRAKATIAFFIPRRLTICIAPALSQDHPVEQSAANDGWVSRADYVNTEARAMTARRTFYTQSSCPLCPQRRTF